MAILERVGRTLVQKASEKVLKETNIGKKITQSLTPKKPPNIGEGTTLPLSKEVVSRMDTERQLSPIKESINSFSEIDFTQDFQGVVEKTPKIKSGEQLFKDIENNVFAYDYNEASYKVRDANKFKDDIFSIARGEKVNKNLETILGKDKYDKLKTFRQGVDEASNSLRGQEESSLRGFISGQSKYAPFGLDIAAEGLSKVSGKIQAVVAEGDFQAKRLPSMKETEFAKQELAAKGEYDLASKSRFFGAVQSNIAGYVGLGKVVDTALLGTKIPGLASSQKYLQDAYINSPRMFNLISNSAQEAIEYGVRKSLGDKEYGSATDVAAAILGIGIATKYFSHKPETIRDMITSADMRRMDKIQSDILKSNPEATADELIEGIMDVKVENGMKVREMMSGFANRFKSTEAPKVSPDKLADTLADGGVGVTSGGAKVLANTINEVNSLLKQVKPTKLENPLSEVKDISLFKSELLAELSSGKMLDSKAVREVVEKKAKEYNLQLRNDDYKIDLLDEVEEKIIKEDANITVLGNPKNFDNFGEMYGRRFPMVNWDKLDSLDNIISTTKGKTPESSIKLNTAKIEQQKLIDNYGVKSMRELEDKAFGYDKKARYAELKKDSKNLVKKGNRTVVSDDVIDKDRSKYISSVRKAEKKFDDVLKRVSKYQSRTSLGEYEKIAEFMNLANNINKGDYLEQLEGATLRLNKLLNNGESFIESSVMTKNRINKYVVEVQNEAKSRPDGEFKLFGDESYDWINPLRLAGRGLNSALTQLDSFHRVFSTSFGENSSAYKVFFGDIAQRESAHNLNKIKWEGDSLRAILDAKLQGQDMYKFSISMYGRVGKIEDRITNARNLYIDGKGRIYDGREGFDGKTLVENLASKGEVRKLTKDDVIRITREMQERAKSDKALANAYLHFDNQFYSGANKLNTQLYEDSGLAISPEKKYFPIVTGNTSYFKGDDETKNTLTQMMQSTIYQGFLKPRKGPPGAYDLELDLPTIVRHYSNNQMYYIDMKDAVMQAKRVARGSNNGTVQKVYEIDGDDIKIIDDLSGDTDMGFSPKMKQYFDEWINHVETRGVAKGSVPWIINRISNLITIQALGFNEFPVLSQVYSLLDASMIRSKSGMAYGFSTLTGGGYSKDSSAFKYSGELLSRQSEYIQGTSTYGLLRSDLSSVSSSKGTGKNLQTITDTSLRMMKRVDGEVSFMVWNSAMYDYLTKNFPEKFARGKVPNDVDEIRNIMDDDVAFNRAISYADREMQSVMASSTSVSHASMAKRNYGAAYKVSTAIQKTFINRMLFMRKILNDNGWKKVPDILVWAAVMEGAEYEREYLREKKAELLGRKELVDTGSHLGNIVANNPSLQYDGWITQVILGDDASEQTKIGVRMAFNFISHSIWNPTNTYSYAPSSIFRNTKKVIDKSADLPNNRFYPSLALGLIKDTSPSLVRDLANIGYVGITGEKQVKTDKDNKALQSILRATPEKRELIESMTFDKQSIEATIKQDVDKAQKIISDREKMETEGKKKIINELYSVYGVPTKDELLDYAKKNRQKMLDAGIGKKMKDLDGFVLDVAEYGRKLGEGEAALLPTNIEVIYEYKLKAIAESGDLELLKAEVERMGKDGIIKDRKGTIKKIKGFLKRDGLLGY